MKTLKVALVSALITLTTSAFAGNMENCSSCGTQKAETASLLKADSAALTDSNVKGMLQNMTQHVHEKVNTESVHSILQNMTQTVRQKVQDNADQNVF